VPTPAKLQDSLIGYPVLPNLSVNRLNHNSIANTTITAIAITLGIATTDGLGNRFNRSEM
jgi:hypothetical protein